MSGEPNLPSQNVPSQNLLSADDRRFLIRLAALISLQIRAAKTESIAGTEAWISEFLAFDDGHPSLTEPFRQIVWPEADAPAPPPDAAPASPADRGGA